MSPINALSAYPHVKPNADTIKVTAMSFIHSSVLSVAFFDYLSEHFRDSNVCMIGFFSDGLVVVVRNYEVYVLLVRVGHVYDSFLVMILL